VVGDALGAVGLQLLEGAGAGGAGAQGAGRWVAGSGNAAGGAGSGTQLGIVGTGPTWWEAAMQLCSYSMQDMNGTLL
jgi:hypothetical protein